MRLNEAVEKFPTLRGVITSHRNPLTWKLAMELVANGDISSQHGDKDWREICWACCEMADELVEVQPVKKAEDGFTTIKVYWSAFLDSALDCFYTRTTGYSKRQLAEFAKAKAHAQEYLVHMGKVADLAERTLTPATV